MDFSTHDFHARRGAALAANANDIDQPPARDMKRSVLIFGLGVLSWVATYVGMLELIEANLGDLPLIHKVIIGFSVAMLMTMIIWLLDQLFKPHPFVTKAAYLGGYVFLSIISIGFGFGFYWKVLESRGESSRSAESAVSQVQNSLHGASTRLEQLQATLAQLTAVSTGKADIERTKGTSCPDSKPGDGPRRKMRDEDAQRFSFASEFVKGRVAQVKGDMGALNGDLQKIVTADASTFDAKSGTRNEFMRALGRKLDLTVTGFNAFRTDPQLRQIRTDLADRAEKTTFGDGKRGAISCPDPQLQTALRGVVKAIDQLPELAKPEIAAVEGSEATIEAFRRLTTTFYGLLAFKLPPSADELRDLQKKAVQSVETPNTAEVRAAALAAEQGGLSKRDYVPLAVALFVDLCLLLVTMAQRPAGRLSGLVPKMQAAEAGPVIQILSRFNDIHKDREIRENFEIFRHIVFDMNGDYYAAVPLDAPPRLNPHEREALRVEAQLLSNLFASFEKEKIFKRTLLPTLPSVQKRLKRQGSKFAGAEAFRVYKFVNGAWSDIILGAVMGAARRVEAAQAAGRRQGPNDRMAPLPEPLPDAPSADYVAPAAKPEQHIEQRAAAMHVSPAQVMTAAAPAGALRRAQISPEFHAEVHTDTSHARRFGPYAHAYRPDVEPFSDAPHAPRVPRPVPPPLPEADVTVKPAANLNVLAANVEGNIERNVATSDDAATVDVTLARETATISMPVSDARLPGSLRSALSKLDWRRVERAEQKPGAEVIALAARTVDDHPVSDDDLMDVEDLSEPIENHPLSDRDFALIGRMAPPAAE